MAFAVPVAGTVHGKAPYHKCAPLECNARARIGAPCWLPHRTILNYRLSYKSKSPDHGVAVVASIPKWKGSKYETSECQYRA